MINYLSREEVKKIQLCILDHIDTLCRNNSIDYYLSYGTLLGAVRHKGFIPWDDDIDVYMERNDYERFIKVAKQCYFEGLFNYKLYDGDEKGYYYPFAKMVDSTTHAKMKDNLTKHGVWVDIFPVDTLPQKTVSRYFFVKNNSFLRNMIIAMTTDFSGTKKSLKTTVKKFLNGIANIIGKEKIYKHTVFYNQKYNGTNSKYVSCLSGAYALKEVSTVEIMFSSTELLFEGKMYKATKNWNEYLSNIYGDYMVLPPEDKRKIHSVEAWKD